MSASCNVVDLSEYRRKRNEYKDMTISEYYELPDPMQRLLYREGWVDFMPARLEPVVHKASSRRKKWRSLTTADVLRQVEDAIRKDNTDLTTTPRIIPAENEDT